MLSFGESYTEESSNLLRSDADSIIINVADDIHTGNGNNLIFNWADNATISTGSGNDNVTGGKDTLTLLLLPQLYH